MLKLIKKIIKNKSDNVIHIPLGQKRQLLLNKIKAIKEIQLFNKCNKTKSRYFFNKLKKRNFVDKNNNIKWDKIFSLIKQQNQKFKQTK